MWVRSRRQSEFDETAPLQIRSTTSLLNLK